MAQVLVLEDDVGLRFAFCEAFQNNGHEVIAASSTKNALHLLYTYKPDILLLDLMVGSESSTDIANYAAVALPDAQIIFVTGSGLFPNGELFDISKNVRFILRKPVFLDDLTGLINYISNEKEGQYWLRA